MYWTFFYCYPCMQPLSQSFFCATKFEVHVSPKGKDTYENPSGLHPWQRLGAKLASQTNTRLPVLRRTERQAYKPRKDWCLMLGGLTKATVCSFFIVCANCKLTNRRVTEIPRHVEHCLPLPSQIPITAALEQHLRSEAGDVEIKADLIAPTVLPTPSFKLRVYYYYH